MFLITGYKEYSEWIGVEFYEVLYNRTFTLYFSTNKSTFSGKKDEYAIRYICYLFGKKYNRKLWFHINMIKQLQFLIGTYTSRINWVI